MKHSILKLFVLPLVFALVTMAGQLNAQSTYSSAIYLCNSAGVYNLNTSNTELEAGPNYGCLPNTPGLRRNAHWFRFQVGTSGNLSLMPTPTVNVNLNYVVWGPFNDPDPGVAALTSANIAACDASPALVSALQMTGLLANQYYIFCLTSEEGLAGTFNFVPQTGNSMVFGSSIRPLGAPTNPSSIVACSPSFFIQTWPALNNISGVQFSGPGIVNPSTGEFDPIVASSSANGGFGLKTITITGNPYGCAPRSATYSINVTPCPSYPCVQNPSNTSTLCWNSFVPPLNASCFNISLLPSGVTLASYQWEVQYQNTTPWVNVGSGPSLNALIATNSMHIRVVAVLSNGVRVPSNEVFFTVLPPIQRSQLSVQGGGRDIVCYEGNLTIIASPTNGGGNQFSYQWERLIGAGAWTNFGAPTPLPLLSLNGLVATAAYRLKATDISVYNCGTVYSDEMTITVLNPVTPGTIQPVSQNLCLDNPVSINVNALASGSGAPSYQWEYSVDQNSWIPITGATTANYLGGAETIAGTGLAAPGTRFYRRKIAYQSGTVICPSTPLYSNVVTVTWIDDLPYVAFSSTETFSGPFSHPWPNTSGIISNSTSGGIVLTTSGATAGNNGTSHYRLPASIVPSDGIITFTYNSSWIVGGSNVASAPSGVTNLLAAFEINGVPFSLLNGGSTYALKVSAGNSIGFSIGFLNQNATGTVQFRGTISNFKFYPKSSSGSSIKCSLAPQELTPIVAPANGVAYLWSTSNGAGVFTPTNTTANATYIPTAADNGQTIILTLVARRLSGECANRNTSATYSITYRNPFVRANVLTTSADTVCYAGIPGALVATAASGGSGPYTYQWQYREDGTENWVNIPGATQLTYNIPIALLASHFYRILSTDAGLPSCGNGISNEIKITVLNPLTAPTFPGTSSPSLTTVSGFPYLTARICPNTTQTLTPTASTGGNNLFCYTWQAVEFSAVNPNLLNQPHLWPWVDIRVCSSLISFTTPSMPAGSKRFYRVIGEDQPNMTPVGCGSPWSLPVLVEAYDVIAPVINVINNIQFFVDANCSITVSNPAALNNGSTDNCPGALVNWTLTPNSFTGTGSRTAVLTASDLSGNVGSRNINLSLLDNINPVARAKNLTVYLDDAGSASIPAIDVNNGSSDNCTAPSALVLSPSVFNFNCSNVTNLVPLTRTLTVTDESDNSNSANFQVHVRDTVPPVFTNFPSNITLSGSGFQCSASHTWTPPSASDACGIASLTVTPNLGSCYLFPQGVTTVTYTATDNNGNSKIDSFTVTVTGCQGASLSLKTNSNNYCVDSFVDVNVMLDNYVGGLGAISLTIDYPSNKMNFQSIVSALPSIPLNSVSANAVNGKLRIAWAPGLSDTVNICQNSVLLFRLRFNTNSIFGSAGLTFDQSIPENNELATGLGVLIPCTYSGVTSNLIPCRGIYGQVTYPKSPAVPLNNVIVSVSSGATTFSGITNSDGNYYISGRNLSVGTTYNVSMQIPIQDNGYNATDANKIIQHQQGTTTLSGCLYFVGDVNSSNFINSADALSVRRRFVGLDPSFIRGPWVVCDNTVNYTSFLTSKDISAVVTGDVDLSKTDFTQNPPTRSSTLVLDNFGSISKDQLGYVIPVYVDKTTDLGAASIVFSLPEGLRIDDVKFVNHNTEEWTWNQVNNTLRLAWNSVHGISTEPSTPLFTIHTRNMVNGSIGLIAEETEFATPLSEVISGLEMRIPLLNSTNKLVSIYPNPSNGVFTLKGLVERYQIYDASGRLVMSGVSNGSNMTIDMQNHAVGFYQVQVQTSEGSETIRLVIRK
jgi:hypothetical protein